MSFPRKRESIFIPIHKPMEIFLLLVVIVILLISYTKTQKEIRILNEQITYLTSKISSLIQNSVRAENFLPQQAPAVSSTKEETPKVEEPKKEIPVSSPPKIEIPKTAQPISEPYIPKKSFIKRFFENNPDMEKFIGENLINKIGIGILVLGISFFVKYAIDQNWIGEVGRVAIGILAGGILIGFAHYMRNSFRAFSSVLVGGGLSVLYFTIGIAFHEYQLFSQTVAFIIMVFITGFAVLLSILYDRKELAALSVIGGFATPLIVSTGEGNYIILFTYLLILNCGMLVLAYFKKWNIVNILSYIFTIFLYGIWLVKKLGNVDAPYIGGLSFGIAFYLVFLAMNILNNIKEQQKFSVWEIIILISNTMFFYFCGMASLHYVSEGMFQGIFTASMGIINFIVVATLYKREYIDKNLLYLLIGIVLTFVSLIAPIQLEGNYITMFWAIEAVLLLWFSQKSGLNIIKNSSIIVTLLMLISLIMDWENIYGDNYYYEYNPLYIIFNQACITGIISIASLYGTRFLLKNETQPFNFKIFQYPIKIHTTIISIILTIITYITFLLELNYQLYNYIGVNYSKAIIIGTYNYLFILGIIVYAQRKSLKSISLTAIIIACFGMFLYLVHYNIVTGNVLREYFFDEQGTIVGFWFHYISMLLMCGILFYGYKIISQQYKQTQQKIALWFIAFMIVLLASSEVLYTILYSQLAFSSLDLRETQLLYYETKTQIVKVGFPIVWGLCAFIFMLFGMKKSNKTLRIISLTLFAITLVKLFVYDIRDISEGGKILAFVLLGVLLLVISFMYQKIKKYVFEEGEKSV